MDTKQYVIDFIEGRVNVTDFFSTLKNDPRVFDWLQSLVSEGENWSYDFVWNGSSYDEIIGPYDVRRVFSYFCKRGGETRAGNQLNIHDWIYRLVKKSFPDESIKIDTTIENKFNFLLEACPEYLLSVDVESSGILEELMEEFPETMSKGKRIKAFKEKLKSMFFIEGQKYPRWIQDSEWPLSKTGKPTKFLRQKSKGEISYYYFLDVDTNEEIQIIQAY